MTTITGEGGGGLGPGPKRKRSGEDEDPNDRQPKKPHTPQVPECPICLSPLVDDQLTLPGQGSVCGHSCHSACLRHSVESGLASEVGSDDSGVWYRAMPPRCPVCRTRFLAATYWPDLAYADQYPDEGQNYFVAAQQDGDQSEDDSFEESSGESDSGSEGEDGGWYGGQGQDSGYQSDGYDSDSGSGYVHQHVTCGQCNQNLGHVEQRVDDFLAATNLDDPACYICQASLADDDSTQILVCQNCGAPSHFHD